MKITKDNLNEVMFENQDARLLIEDVVTHTGASLYYGDNGSEGAGYLVQSHGRRGRGGQACPAL